MSLLSFTGLYRPFRHKSRPGDTPGVVRTSPDALPSSTRVITYTDDHLVEQEEISIDDLPTLILEDGVSWVDVAGLSDGDVIERIGRQFGLHPLALEDVVHVHQRAKVEAFDEHLFIVVRMVSLPDRLEHEQVALFVGKDYVVTFQERRGDCLEPVRRRLREHRGRIRSAGADYLAYALLDAIVDHYFPIVEAYGGELDRIEGRIDRQERDDVIGELHDIRSDLLLLRRLIWPHRELFNSLLRDGHPLIAPETLPYLRDCYDHTVQVIDVAETYRDTCADLRDFHYSQISQRTNDVVKVLTIISSVFIPLSFVAGLYGMNFNPEASPVNMPELNWYFRVSVRIVADGNPCREHVGVLLAARVVEVNSGGISCAIGSSLGQ